LIKDPLRVLCSGRYRWEKYFALLDIARAACIFAGIFCRLAYDLVRSPNYRHCDLAAPSQKELRWGAAGDSMVLDFGSSSYFHLNETGGRIRELLKEGKDPAEIAVIFSQEYEISREESETDIRDFMATLDRIS
jgi:hypothetical protein